MIYRFSLFFASILSAVQVSSQPGNLVENPGFEFRPECDDNNGPLEEAPPWFNPTGATPDVFHECAVQNEAPCPYPDQLFLDPWLFGVPTNVLGCQFPKTGSGYAGFYAYSPTFDGSDFREYLAVPLSETMISGTTYLVRFYLSLAERSLYSVSSIQVSFSSEPLTDPLNIGILNSEVQLTTQDEYFDNRNAWDEVSWEYEATGNENYMYIGNFQANSIIDTAYSLAVNIDPEDHYLAAYYYLDDVYVGSDIVSNRHLKSSFEVSIWPNPADEFLNIDGNIRIKDISIYSSVGTIVNSQVELNNTTARFNTSNLSPGLYIIETVDYKGNNRLDKFLKR
jgi:hypothetical protein